MKKNFDLIKNKLNVEILFTKHFAKFQNFIFDMMWKVANIC